VGVGSIGSNLLVGVGFIGTNLSVNEGSLGSSSLINVVVGSLGMPKFIHFLPVPQHMNVLPDHLLIIMILAVR